MSSVKIVVILLILVLGAAFYFHITNVYQGKITDHYDGVHFFNPNENDNRPFYKFLYWAFTRKPSNWDLYNIPVSEKDIPPSIVNEGLRVSHIGHATILIQVDGINIITDPVYSEKIGFMGLIGPIRHTPPGIDFDDLPKIDVMLISHNHYDHMDLETIKRISKRDAPTIITPLGNDAYIKHYVDNSKISVLDWYESVGIHNVDVHLVPALHWSGRYGLDKNRALWGGFVIKTSKGNVYFSGDVGLGSINYYKEIHKRYGDMEFSLIATGAYMPRWFMKNSHTTPEESAIIFRTVGSKYGFAVHHSTFQLSDESPDDQRIDFEKAVHDFKIDDRFKFPKAGDYWYIE
jgi:L-ascorbate metabolism protein UlaG (beta-lactamase superfamily)